MEGAGKGRTPKVCYICKNISFIFCKSYVVYILYRVSWTVPGPLPNIHQKTSQTSINLNGAICPWYIFYFLCSGVISKYEIADVHLSQLAQKTSTVPSKEVSLSSLDLKLKITLTVAGFDKSPPQDNYRFTPG